MFGVENLKNKKGKREKMKILFNFPFKENHGSISSVSYFSGNSLPVDHFSKAELKS